VKINEEGYQASYTLPIYNNKSCIGFVFFNSSQKNCFTKEVLDLIDIFAHLVSNVVKNDINTIKTMLAAFRTANQMVHLKDPETGSHLERMAHFSRLIAKELSYSEKYSFNDEFIEDIFIFAPMHDVGKIGIPDEVLKKPAKLNKDEWRTMQTHAYKGRMVINTIIENFEFETIANINVLRNIAEYHHEALNGNGYPHGMKGKNIPIEARIVAVADVFDALTNKRPYKKAWSNSEAFITLKKLANDVLDQDCVNALLLNQKKVTEIQGLFRD
jgi:HD-GYP domain-containing protein (c-di-GMP phosphodiesterase class II)